MTSDYVLPRFDSAINTLLIAAGLFALAVPPSLAQAGAVKTATSLVPASAPHNATMTFDVASVRQNKDIDLNARFIINPGYFVPNSTTFHAVNSSIENLICLAFGVQEHQIAGAPDWPWPTFFMVEAKSDSEADARLAALTRTEQWAEQQHMLQSLLEERFKLKTHWETRGGDAYNLVVAKGGPKLGKAGSIPPSAEELKMAGDHPVSPFWSSCDGHGCIWIAHGEPMDQLVSMLTMQFGRPVKDKTELTAKYDFVLKFAGRWDRDRPAEDMNPTPPLDRALQEELGLKVETAKGNVTMLVIDHIEKPSAN